MALFSIITLSCYDLFENGFWTSYNRSFGTLRHVEREFKSSPTFVEVDYKYLFNGNEITGNGYVIEATENESIIFTNQNQILNLTTNDNRIRDIEILPSRSNTIFKIETQNFYSISIDSLKSLMKNKIVSGQITSESDFYFDRKLQNKSVEFKHNFNPQIMAIQNTNQSEILEELKLKKAEARKIYFHNRNEKLKLETLKSDLNQLENQRINSADIYSKNKIENLIIEKKKEISKFKLDLISNPVLFEEIKLLESKLNMKVQQKFSGELNLISP